MNSYDWLLQSKEPWTIYRTRVDLLDQPEADPQVQAARQAMLAHPGIQALIEKALTWGEEPLKRHNDAAHSLYALSTLADFGINLDDPGLSKAIEQVHKHRSSDGFLLTKILIPTNFGGSGRPEWTWILCDMPTLLYSLLQMGIDPETLRPAIDGLLGLADANGWRCRGAIELGSFRGPGRKEDPCPITNVLALKALSLEPEFHSHPSVEAALEMLLWHWENRSERKIYMFGIGTTFRRLKYPYVWYDILHVLEVLSRFPRVHPDPRFKDMIVQLTSQADDSGHYTAGSMYRAWNAWPFADKKKPSPWLTFLVNRIQKRLRSH